MTSGWCIAQTNFKLSSLRRTLLALKYIMKRVELWGCERLLSVWWEFTPSIGRDSLSESLCLALWLHFAKALLHSTCLIDSTMAPIRFTKSLLHSNLPNSILPWFYFPLAWFYLTLLHSTMGLVQKLPHSPPVYPNSTSLYNGSTLLYLTLLHSTHAC